MLFGYMDYNHILNNNMQIAYSKSKKKKTKQIKCHVFNKRTYTER